MPNDDHDNSDSLLNPFSPQQPAQPEYFADRKEDLSDFRRMAINSARLKIPAPVNYAILGTWGQGKTSFLYKFRQMVTEDLQKEIKCACIYFALSPESCRSWERFTSDFLQDIPSNLTSSSALRRKLRAEVVNWEVTINMGVVGATRKRQELKPRLLDALQTLWEKHLAASGTQIAFIMFDDLHYFPTRESAYLTLRTTFQELVNRKCNYALIVTAPTLLFTDIAEVAEPLGRFFKPIDLTMFTFEDTKEAIEIRLRTVKSKVKVTDDTIRAILEKTGGHPYLVIFTMHEMLNALGEVETIDVESFVKHWPKIETLLGRQIFAQKFQHASPTERRLLIEIAKKDSKFVSPGFFTGFKGASRLFARLEEEELLVRSERGKYTIFHPLFAEYLKKQ